MTKTIRARIMLAITPSGEWEAVGYSPVDDEATHNERLRYSVNDNLIGWAEDPELAVYHIVEVYVPVPEPREKGVLQGRVVEGET